MTMDSQSLWLFGGLLGLLSVASGVGFMLAQREWPEKQRGVIENLNARIYAWWIMAAVLGGALALGKGATVLLFALMSFVGLREFITLTPTRAGDHRALFWAFFIILPLHYATLYAEWYGLFVVLIPVYAFLFIPMRNAMAGDTDHFLERTAKVQWGLMVSVYFTSYAPALLLLDIPGFAHQQVKLVFFLIFVVQISDVLQYCWGKLCGKRALAPRVSPSKTLEGLVGGGLSAVACGALLSCITPFTWWQAGLLSAAIVVMGFFGGLVMSAIKRDRGVKDYGELIPGHGGMMDRIDSICFAAPVFFHLVRYFFTV